MDLNSIDLTKINVDNGTEPAKVEVSLSEQFIKDVATSFKVSYEQASVGVAIICQKGGTAKKAQGTIYAIVDGVRMELSSVLNIMRSKNYKFTLRQWARTNAEFIYKVGSAFGIHGDLAKKLGRMDQSLSEDDLYWLSNFQMDNGSCPDKVRNILLDHYNNMFKKGA